MTALQRKQFGFPIQGFPEGNPHLSRETQGEAGLRYGETFLPNHPSFEEPFDIPLTQHGGPRWSEEEQSDFRLGTPQRAEEAGITEQRLRTEPQRLHGDNRLFDDRAYAARPQDQTPDAWLRRPDVMFHTGVGDGSPFETNDRQTHYGTAAVALEVRSKPGHGNRTVARRIKGLDEMPSAVDMGAQAWAPMTAQYENQAEDKGSVSVVGKGSDSSSWVEDQLDAPNGRFKDYAQQLNEVAFQRQGQPWPDTSFHFNKVRNVREAVQRDRSRRNNTPGPTPVDPAQPRLNPDYGKPSGWTEVWNKTMEWPPR